MTGTLSPAALLRQLWGLCLVALPWGAYPQQPLTPPEGDPEPQAYYPHHPAHTQADTVAPPPAAPQPARVIARALEDRNALDALGLDRQSRQVAWRFNPIFFGFEPVPIDSSLWMNHLFYPQHRHYETFTFLGNLGSPTQFDHFFTRPRHAPFLFGRYYSPYLQDAATASHYHVRSPFTVLHYTTAGRRSEAEQVFSVLHTQNMTPHINFGLTYNFYGTKGSYARQETRNNVYGAFASYHRGNRQAQVSFASHVFRNQESGGVALEEFNPDAIRLKLIRTRLLAASQAQSQLRQRSLSANLGYALANVRRSSTDSLGVQTQHYEPLVTARFTYTHARYSRVYTDQQPSPTFYPDFFISRTTTHDSVFLRSHEVCAAMEIAQFARVPGMPGIRAWVGHEWVSYNFFTPRQFVWDTPQPALTTSHVGLGAFSSSPHLSYRGALRLFVDGYRAQDTELQGELRLSPWRDPQMPQLVGQISLTRREPSLFFERYFSNHHQWDQRFDKESRLWMGAKLRVDRWWTEVGYNVEHITNFHYLNTQAMPSQAANVTITSLYLQNRLTFFGVNVANRVVFQANSNPQALSLPTVMAFASLFYDIVLVRDALRGQFGVNVFYRSRFYTDAFSPAIAQFHNQRLRQFGGYPMVDVFANFKWKRTLLFAKFEHLNQGQFTQHTFITAHYPPNPRMFKFGLTWFFYD